MRTDTEAEASILWPPDMRNWLIRKDPNGGEDWNQEEKRTTENEIGSMASPTRWTWVWASSWNWWWAGKPGMLQSMGSKMVGHDWVTELNWTELLSHSDSLWPPKGFPRQEYWSGLPFPSPGHVPDPEIEPTSPALPVDFFFFFFFTIWATREAYSV